MSSEQDAPNDDSLGLEESSTGTDPNPENDEQTNELEDRLFRISRNKDNENEDGENQDNDSNDDDDDDDSDSDDDSDRPELPPVVQKRVEKLKELNVDRDEIMERYLKERAALEKKYAQLCSELYQKRFEYTSGELDHRTIVEKAKAGNNGEDEEEQLQENNDADIRGIPQFWLVAMSNMPSIAETISQADVECLEHLQNISCVDDDDGTGFTLRFFFAPNNYFHNTVLTKRYEVPNLLLADEPILKKVTGCDIQWKTGRSLTSREVTKKQRSKSGRKAGQIRTVKKTERTDSFFHFFSPPKMPSMIDMSEEEADALEEAFDHDYDVAQSFRSHVVPKAVLWFTEEAMEDGMQEMFEEAAQAGLG